MSLKTLPVPFESCTHFYVDGKCVGGKAIWNNDTFSTGLLGMQVSPTTLRPLTFSSMETTGKYLHRGRYCVGNQWCFFWQMMTDT